MDSCIFCKIVKKELPSEVIFENETLVVFKDIHPSAPVHLLIVPKFKKSALHIDSINDLKEENRALASEMIFVARQVAVESGLDAKGYKLVFNVGRGGGQIIDHLHLHLLGGWSEKDTRHLP